MSCPTTGLRVAEISIDFARWHARVASHTVLVLAGGHMTVRSGAARALALQAGDGVVLPAGATIAASATGVRGWLASYGGGSDPASPSEPIAVHDVPRAAMVRSDLSAGMSSEGDGPEELTHTYFASADGRFSIQAWCGSAMSFPIQPWPSSEFVRVVQGRVRCSAPQRAAEELGPGDAAAFFHGAPVGWQQTHAVRLLLVRATAPSGGESGGRHVM